MSKAYLTEQNIDQKVESWLSIIRPFYYDRKDFVFVPKKSALVIIDMQKYFAHSDGRAYLHATKAIIPRIDALLRRFRNLKLPVIFTRHGHKSKRDLGIMGRFWGDYIRFGEKDWQIIDELCPKPDEIVIDKTRYDAFFRTPLDSILKKLGVKQLVITGVMTHLCCETTARCAFSRNYEVYFVCDATATSREEFHIGTLRALANGFGILVKSSDILNSLK